MNAVFFNKFIGLGGPFRNSTKVTQLPARLMETGPLPGELKCRVARLGGIPPFGLLFKTNWRSKIETDGWRLNWTIYNGRIPLTPKSPAPKTSGGSVFYLT